MKPNKTENPLLHPNPYPRFDEIEAAHVEPAVTELLDRLESELDQVEACAQPSWEGVVEPIERIGDGIERVWGVVGHLMGVKNSDELREAHQSMQPAVVGFATRLGQSRPIYDALKKLQKGQDWETINSVQQRVVENLLRDAELSGVGLDGAAKERFNAIELELAELYTRFSNNVLDATKAFAMELKTKKDVAGLPQSLLAMAAHAAREAGNQAATAENGPWRITLDGPSLAPFLEHSKRRDLREKLYRAHITRASDGEYDNTPLLDSILSLRAEQAALLGFTSFAEMSLATKMAPSVKEVTRLLGELRKASYNAAVADLEELRAFAAEEAPTEAAELMHWDIGFWAERLREKRYAFNDEDLRPYFPLPEVLEGLFALAAKLFGVRIEAADGTVPVWHDDVGFFHVLDADGERIAAFYFDPYSRPAEKRGGAWMDECMGRTRVAGDKTNGADNGLRLPVAYVVCNQSPPVDGKPSLMNFTELRTVFHEFGHALQHMLTRVDYGLVSGIRGVEWDAVELPSQFMENWCYHKETLQRLSKHVETGEQLPDELYEKIVRARNYRSGSQMLRQVYFAMTDMALHDKYRPRSKKTPFDLQREIAKKTTVMEPLPEDRFLCGFAHIFAGGYAAGYYSYKWSEVLSADAFSAFEEAGLDNQTALEETGRRYRETVLALGGSRAPIEVFTAFRGRGPSTHALLRHAGLRGA